MITFAMLLANNNRSKAYLQHCLACGFRPEQILYIDTGIGRRLPEHTDNDVLFGASTSQRYIRTSVDAGVSFDEKEHITVTAQKEGIPFEAVQAESINEPSVVQAVGKLRSRYVVYSGPGGALLRKEILTTGKTFIHVHPGWLPDYPGSTTMYYSMLAEGSVAASVIVLDEQIDAGPILFRKKFKVTDAQIDLDYVFDPAVRAATLVEFFKTVSGDGLPAAISPEGNRPDVPFFIVHPVLKHLAVLKMRKEAA